MKATKELRALAKHGWSLLTRLDISDDEAKDWLLDDFLKAYALGKAAALDGAVEIAISKGVSREIEAGRQIPIGSFWSPESPPSKYDIPALLIIGGKK